MLSGRVPPPDPEDLKLRPLDVSLAIDAAAAGKLGLPGPVRPEQVVAMGQSWGSTTVLQLAGVRPSATLLSQSCEDLLNPARNPSLFKNRRGQPECVVVWLWKKGLRPGVRDQRGARSRAGLLPSMPQNRLRGWRRAQSQGSGV